MNTPEDRPDGEEGHPSQLRKRIRRARAIGRSVKRDDLEKPDPRDKEGKATDDSIQGSR